MPDLGVESIPESGREEGKKREGGGSGDCDQRSALHTNLMSNEERNKLGSIRRNTSPNTAQTKEYAALVSVGNLSTSFLVLDIRRLHIGCRLYSVAITVLFE